MNEAVPDRERAGVLSPEELSRMDTYWLDRPGTGAVALKNREGAA